MVNTISILGCGWLGFPLALHLLTKGYTIKGSTTSTDKLQVLKENGIIPYHIVLNPVEAAPGDFYHSDLLIINIPPSSATKSGTTHMEQMKGVASEIRRHGIKKVIFISSTSVYANVNTEVTEADVYLADDHILLHVENLLKNIDQCTVTILRCAGLMGYNRVPGKYFKGKKALDTGEIPVNYIHRDDVVAIIARVIEEEPGDSPFNVVAPLHPKRKDVYIRNAKDFEFEAPTFVIGKPTPFKIVNGDKLSQRLDYHFKYPNPMEFYAT